MKDGVDFEFTEESTSDLSFVARGRRGEDALIAASEALLAATLEEPDQVRATCRVELVLEEADLDLLLLRFLNELIYLRDARGLLLRGQSARLVAVESGYRLEMELAGEPWCPARHVGAMEVKAATAHGLALRPVADGWEARATLDV